MKYKVTVRVILDYERRVSSFYGWRTKEVCEIFILSEVVEKPKRSITREFVQFDLDCMRYRLEIGSWKFHRSPELCKILSIEKVPKDTKISGPNDFVIEGIVEQRYERKPYGFSETELVERVITDRDKIKEMM